MLLGSKPKPEFRSRGYGKFVVNAAMSDAFERGYIVAYQTLMANTPAGAIATTLGCQDYAGTLAAYLTSSPGVQHPSVIVESF